MIEVTGDMWTMPSDYRCITTNFSINRDGACVMGRGVALQAKQRYPWLARYLGDRILEGWTKVILLPENLIAFPVKYKWSMKADLDLIRESTRTLQIIAKATQWVGTQILLPRPGCGNGGLLWKDVKPIVRVLPDNVKVINYG